MSDAEELAGRREAAIERLMLMRAELRKRAVEEMELAYEIDSTIRAELRRIGLADPESIVATLEALVRKVGNAL